MAKASLKDPDMAGTRAALIRATRRACELAKMHGLLMPISRGGKVVKVPPEEILAELDKAETKNPTRRGRSKRSRRSQPA